LIYLAVDDGSRKKEGKIEQGKKKEILEIGMKIRRTKHAKIFILLFFVFFNIFL
jgi:hypothetical protein